MESMIEIPLISGEHKIELRYVTPGLAPGGCISLFCLAVFVGICMVKRKRDHMGE